MIKNFTLRVAYCAVWISAFCGIGDALSGVIRTAATRLHQCERCDSGRIRSQDARAQCQPQDPGLAQQQGSFFFGEAAPRYTDLHGIA